MAGLNDLKRTAIAGPYNKAAELYGVDDLIHTKIPRSKNQFEISFDINSNEYPQELVFGRVAQVTLPDYDFNVMTMNQYNRVRHYPTSLKPSGFTIAFYDTRDNQFQFILERYAQFYAHGLQVDSNSIVKYDTTSETFDRTFGLRATGNGRDRYFFNKVTIKTIDVRTTTGENTRTIDCWNCMINTVNHDTLDYSTANPVMWQVSFMPEHVNIRADGEISSPESSRRDYAIFEKVEGNIVYAVDKDGEYILNSDGQPIILRTLSNQGLLTPSNSGSTTEDGEPLVDESGNPI